ncbi:hypothetical protein [Candidatus Coxiella mudrowiae]|uniref:hypothetical protein n=1 Tax=Candidatus Coxiella mudrowiae TaxID=2054173 RepID=UPI00069DF35E|nr:hypothetical protein [Candidatus Coxiella mudrowiae]
MGWYIGALAIPWLGNQLGLTYHSKIYFSLNGVSQFQGRDLTGALVPDRSIAFDFSRLAIILFRDFQALSKEFGLYGFVYYIFWSIMKTVTVQNIAVSIPPYPSHLHG